MKRRIDFSGEQDMDVLAHKAVAVAEKIREEDPTRVFSELVNLCEFHPVKAAQLLMTYAAWFDTGATTGTLTRRVVAITSDRTTLGKTA